MSGCLGFEETLEIYFVGVAAVHTGIKTKSVRYDCVERRWQPGANTVRERLLKG